MGELEDLRNSARRLRRGLIDLSYRSGSNHIGCGLSIADLIAVIFGRVIDHRPETARTKDRDYFILSKGHACLIYYLALAERGFFRLEELTEQWNRDGSRFCEHPQPSVPGVDVNTGSLGHGLAVGAGLALALPHRRVVVLLGDGECGEGAVWEAAGFAGAHRLPGLCAVVDSNGLQGLGPVGRVSGGVLSDKFAAFGWETLEIDGHDLVATERALHSPRDGRPRAIIARTVKGRGVSFMENKLEWHYRSLSPELHDQAMGELRS